MIVEILFISHVANGIHIIIHYMNSYTNTTLYNYSYTFTIKYTYMYLNKIIIILV